MEVRKSPYSDFAISIMKCNGIVKDCIKVLEKAERKVLKGRSKFHEV